MTFSTSSYHCTYYSPSWLDVQNALAERLNVTNSEIVVANYRMKASGQ